MNIKVLLKSNLPKIHGKLIELNFPVEFFVSQSISSLFSQYFLTDFFLRLMDIIIFEARLKTNEDDKVLFSSITIVQLYEISLWNFTDFIRNE